MRWDLKNYRGQAVHLALSFSLGNQLEGLVWRGLNTLPAPGNPSR